jgi:mono/diheme cytochrome c family protein
MRCHGSLGNGTGLGPQFIKPAPANLVDRYVAPSEGYTILNRGVLGSSMPSFREMPERDLWAIAFYVSKLGSEVKSEIPEKLDMSLVKQGQGIYNQNCAMCHGDSGAGDGPAAASLNPRPKDFTRRVFRTSYLKDILAKGVEGSGMPPFPQFDETSVAAISAYMTSLFQESR